MKSYKQSASRRLMEEVSESIANIQKFKKLGKVVVAVAIAAVFCASLLATGVLAEDVKPSYDTTYFDADQKYFDWFERTAETLIADMTFLYSALNDELKIGGDMDNIYKWSRELEQDAMTAIIELKQFDDVSPGLKAVINRDRQRYEVLRRAGSSCSNGVVFQSKDCFDDCFYNLNRAHHHHEEWNKLFKDYYEDLQEQGVEKAIEDPVSQTRSREADKDTCSGIYDDIDVPGRFGQSTQVPKPTPYKQEIIEKSTPKPTVAPTPETTKEDFEKPQKTSVSTTKVYKEESVTWSKSKSSKKSSSQPEQVEYGELVATKNGIDVTDQILSKPVYIYAYPDIGFFTSSFSTPPEYCIDINVYKDSFWESYDEALEASDSITKRTQYKTYGEVCEALEECILETFKLVGQKDDRYKHVGQKDITEFGFYETSTSNFVIETKVVCQREKKTQTKKEPTTIEEQTTTETIYEPTKYDLDDLDENMCSPREYAYIDKTRNGTMYISCRCKPGYTRVTGGCTFDLPIAGVFNGEELEILESVYRELNANQGTTMKITKDGKTIELGVLRRGDHSLLYTLDGETWDSDIVKIVNPSIIDRIGTLLGNIGDAINPVNWFETPYKNKDKQMQYEIAGETLEAYQEDTKKISQYAYEYYSDAKDKEGAIETLLDGELIKGSAEMAGIETDLLKYTMNFPGQAFTKFADEAQIQQIANGFFVYAEMREEKTWMSPQEIVNDVQAGGYSSWGLDESLGEIILCQLYEESYQRYLLRKTLQAK